MTAWLTFFFAAALLLPPLPIALGDSGPHLCLLIAGIGLLLGIMSLAHWRIRPCGLNAAFTALFGALFVSVAMAALHSGGNAAATSFARVALVGISVYVFFYAAYGPAPRFDDWRATRRIYLFATLSALFACVDFYFQFPAPAGFEPQFVWLDSGVFRRAQGLFYEASTLGNFCAFFLVMIAVALSRPKEESPVSRKLLIAGGAVFFGALVLSFSRGSVINLLVAGAVLAWINRRRVPLRRVVAICGVCAAAGGLLWWILLPQMAAMYWLRLTATGEYFFSATEQVLSGRVASWRTLAAWIAANPWQLIFGIGYKTLPYTTYLGEPVVADNMYLSLLIETGIAGLACLAWLNAAILRASARASRAADPRRSFFGAWMLCFWSGETVQMLSGDLLTYWRVLPVYFFVLALAVRE
ncbi:MAG: O-antigen ligase family protein [Bryobacteraceae bacterium]|jgi:O-Antigen ligase